MREEPVELTVMCMVRDEKGRVLVQRRPAPHWPGLAFPGGHIEPGEAAIECAVREVREETGLTMENPVLCGIRQFTNNEGNRYMVFLYKADRCHGELAGSDEGEALWMPVEELNEDNTARGFLSSLKIFLDDGVQEMVWREDEWVYFP